MKVKSKCPPEQKKNVKYTETKKRINKIRRQLEKLEDIFKENKRINKICKQINKLEEKDFCETYTLIYDRDSTAKENPTNPKIMRDLDEAARIAIGYFSKTCILCGGCDQSNQIYVLRSCIVFDVHRQAPGFRKSPNFQNGDLLRNRSN
ncbi:hypothetical protein ABFS82_14G064500 [Erythranthe guttata]